MARTRVETVPATAGVSFAVELARCGRLSDDELMAELARGLTLSAEQLIKLSAVWAELEGRGKDLSGLRSGLTRYLPLIAAGRLAAESVIAFSGRRSLLRALDGVPLATQLRLAAGEEIEVIDPAAAEGSSRMSLARLPEAAVRLVFDEGQIRDPAAQRLALRPRQKKAERELLRFTPRVDREAGLVRVGPRTTVRLDDLLQALASAAGPELPALIHAEEWLKVETRLSKGEYAALAEAARKAELPVWELIRKALRAMGII